VWLHKKQINYAWGKATTLRNRNPAVWRRDEFGNLIKAGSYGTCGEFGWEIDHRKPRAKGGTDHLRNIRALHHETNREKSDIYPYP